MFGRSKVKMLVSVGGDHIAGKHYRLSAELADKYIARGYAEGSLSRTYSEGEFAVLRGNPQIVGV